MSTNNNDMTTNNNDMTTSNKEWKKGATKVMGNSIVSGAQGNLEFCIQV